MKVGIDFDNTLVSYDDVFLRAAIERELLPQHFTGDKTAVRDSIRLAAGDAHMGEAAGRGLWPTHGRSHDD